MRSTNLLERPDVEIRRWTVVVRIFPDACSCPKLVWALCAEIRERWMEEGQTGKRNQNNLEGGMEQLCAMRKTAAQSRI